MLIPLKQLAKELNKDRETLLRFLENSKFDFIKERHGKITKIFVDSIYIEQIKESMKDNRGGLVAEIPKDKIIMSQLIKELYPYKRNAITSALNYLNYKYVKLNNLYLYDKSCIEDVRNFLNDSNRFSKLSEKRDYKSSSKKGIETKKKLQSDFEINNDLIRFSDLECLKNHYEFDILKACDKNSIEVITYKNVRYIHKSDKDKISKIANTFNRSSKEIELRNWIKSFYKDNVLFDDRKTIRPLELDVYFPKEKVAVEFDGIYYHCELFCDKNYHLSKTKMCEEKGIRLIHIYEDEWCNKQEICKSIILSALNVYDKKIYARNCKFDVVNNNISREFLKENHIQSCVGGESYGLYYKDELVQLITLGKSRFKKNEVELLRMCTKLNTQVIGGFSKLMMNQPYEEIISYVDRRLFNGKGYESSSWKIIKYNSPSYYYFNHGKRENRLEYQKHKLKDKLSVYDETLSEHDNMMNNKIYRIYDCGTIKVKFTKK